MDGEMPGNFTAGDWVEVEGVFRIEERDGQRIPLLSDPVTRAVKAPRQPYLF